MRLLLVLSISLTLSSCWTKVRPNPNPVYGNERVWGNEPIYDAVNDAKQVSYIDSARPVINPGNIYAKGNFIYQLEIGKGIHVIDNTVPAQAHRIGFITVNGSSQISIKSNYLYTNSYDDMLVIDISGGNIIQITKRLVGALPEGRYYYYLSQPTETGYYTCPNTDSVVIGWRKDSIRAGCYKN
ncbi:hypothetical protein BH11BAC4_BH11BAC4_20880 [soil metagenome]